MIIQSIFISLLVVSFTNAADLSNDQVEEINKLDDFYDNLVDIWENQNYGDCQTQIEYLMDLLCDGFQFCLSGNDGVCINKDEYKTLLQKDCGSFKEIDYNITINPSNEYVPATYTSLTCKWSIITDEDCTIKETEQHKIYYNYKGLITKIEEYSMDDAIKNCPGYDDEDSVEPGYGNNSDKPQTTQVDNNEPCEDHTADIHKFYETLVAIVEDCQNNVPKVMPLLSDDFIHNHFKDGIMDHSFNKNEYEQGVLLECARFKEAEYILSPISPCHQLLTIEWILTLPDGCTLTRSEVGKFVFDDNGLITEYDNIEIMDEVITCPTKEPSDAGYGVVTTKATECPHSDGVAEFIHLFQVVLGDCDMYLDKFMGLLSDDFMGYYIKDGEMYSSMNKDVYGHHVSEACDTFKSTKYHLLPTSCDTIAMEMSLTTMEDDCVRSITEERKLEFNNDGLIARFYNNDISESEDCPKKPSGYDATMDTDAYNDGEAESMEHIYEERKNKIDADKKR